MTSLALYNVTLVLIIETPSGRIWRLEVSSDILHYSKPFCLQLSLLRTTQYLKFSFLKKE